MGSPTKRVWRRRNATSRSTSKVSQVSPGGVRIVASAAGPLASQGLVGRIGSGPSSSLCKRPECPVANFGISGCALGSHLRSNTRFERLGRQLIHPRAVPRNLFLVFHESRSGWWPNDRPRIAPTLSPGGKVSFLGVIAAVFSPSVSSFRYIRCVSEASFQIEAVTARKRNHRFLPSFLPA